jgi:ketosteroid isomerase-like protein
MPSMKGKDAIRTALKEFIGDPNVSLTFTSASAEVAKSGDIAYTQGSYTMVQSDMKTKKPITEKGAYVTVYKKQADGSWKAVQDINTPGGPAVPVAPAKKS